MKMRQAESIEDGLLMLILYGAAVMSVRLSIFMTSAVVAIAGWKLRGDG
jgi:hypothetical protein